MKCPDCNSNLTDIRTSVGLLLRCFKCGGFWLDSNVANSLTSREMTQFRRISVSQSWFTGGKGVCPADGLPLSRYIGESVPPNLVVQRCARCGKWWFAGDSLFSYKPAAEAKLNYMRQWGVLNNMRSVLLPVLTVLVLMVGAVAGVNMVKRNQQYQAAADSGVYDVSITYAGKGEAVVVFKADKDVTPFVEYRNLVTLGWDIAPAIRKGDVYVVQLTGLSIGWEYYVMIGGKEYKFTTK